MRLILLILPLFVNSCKTLDRSKLREGTEHPAVTRMKMPFREGITHFVVIDDNFTKLDLKKSVKDQVGTRKSAPGKKAEKAPEQKVGFKGAVVYKWLHSVLGPEDGSVPDPTSMDPVNAPEIKVKGLNWWETETYPLLTLGRDRVNFYRAYIHFQRKIVKLHNAGMKGSYPYIAGQCPPDPTEEQRKNCGHEWGADFYAAFDLEGNYAPELVRNFLILASKGFFNSISISDLLMRKELAGAVDIDQLNSFMTDQQAKLLSAQLYKDFYKKQGFKNLRDSIGGQNRADKKTNDELRRSRGVERDANLFKTDGERKYMKEDIGALLALHNLNDEYRFPFADTLFVDLRFAQGRVPVAGVTTVKPPYRLPAQNSVYIKELIKETTFESEKGNKVRRELRLGRGHTEIQRGDLVAESLSDEGQVGLDGRVDGTKIMFNPFPFFYKAGQESKSWACQTYKPTVFRKDEKVSKKGCNARAPSIIGRYRPSCVGPSCVHYIDIVMETIFGTDKNGRTVNYKKVPGVSWQPALNNSSGIRIHSIEIVHLGSKEILSEKEGVINIPDLGTNFEPKRYDSRIIQRFKVKAQAVKKQAKKDFERKQNVRKKIDSAVEKLRRKVGERKQ